MGNLFTKKSPPSQSGVVSSPPSSKVVSQPTNQKKETTPIQQPATPKQQTQPNQQPAKPSITADIPPISSNTEDTIRAFENIWETEKPTIDYSKLSDLADGPNIQKTDGTLAKIPTDVVDPNVRKNNFSIFFKII